MTEQDFIKNYTTNKSDFLKFSLHLTKSRADAHDLLQEASLKAFINKKQLDSVHKMKAWFRRILFNTYISFYKKRKRRKNLLESNGTCSSLFFNKSSSVNKAISRMRINEIANVVASLKPKYKDSVRLFLLGYSYKEIAQLREIPIGTVKSRINMARKILKKDLNYLRAA